MIAKVNITTIDVITPNCQDNNNGRYTNVSGHCRATTQQNFIKNVCQRSF
jgi:hypothetical protein